MKNNKTPETLLTEAYRSAKIKKLAIIFVLAGIAICMLPLLPPVQNFIFSFIDANIARRGSGGSFENRLRSLLTLPFFALMVFVFAFCCLFSKSIAAFLENPKNTRLIIALTAGTGALLLCCVSVFAYRHGWQWLSNDHSSEMVLGELLAAENRFVSRNWRYSTEIRLIYQTIFTMPLFKLLGRFENWALIRSLNILLNNLVLIASYLYLAKQMKIPVKWICITSLFLIMPISYIYWDIVIFGGYYAFFIAQIFCCLGLFIRLADHDGTVKKALPGFILFMVLSFLLGMQGIRSLLSIYIPLIITCVCLCARMTHNRKSILFLGACGFVACGAGFAGNYLLHFRYSFHSFESMLLTNLRAELFPKLGQSIASLAEFFGIFTGSSLLSAQGLFSVIAVIVTFLVILAVYKSFRQAQAENRLIPVFFMVSILSNIFVFILVNEPITARYFIPFMVLYIPFTATLFERAEKTYGSLKRTALVMGMILFVSSQSFLNFQDMAKMDSNTIRKGYIQYLLDNRLHFGFATSGNANVTAELTNGKIDLAGLNADGLIPGANAKFHITGWLRPVYYDNPSIHQGETFLLMSRAEWNLAGETGRPFTQRQPDYEDSYFIIVRYESSEAVHREVLDSL